MSKNNTICHIADVQIRFGSRHEEYRQVFQRLYKDLEKKKPRRIVVAGDLFHQKVNMSPLSIELGAEFLKNLSKIATVDVIPGNHDLNLRQVSQGDSIAAIIDLLENGYIVTRENKQNVFRHEVNKAYNSIFYYPQTDFYEVESDLVYGVYSCIDNQIISLTQKEKGKKYIALAHYTIQGSRGNNGRELMGDDLIRVSTFNNFDIVMLGDIHEYQTFREDESMAYAGSLIQQDYSESVEKGYLLWNLEDNTHKRLFVLNDFGFAKLNISIGESLEERIKHIKFSHNKKKTKIYIEYEDYEENYSVERENQIIRLVKDKYGCETVNVICKFIRRESDEIGIEEDGVELKNIQELLEDYINQNEFDLSEEEQNDIIELSREIDSSLEIKDEFNIRKKWFINSMEVSNVFSFPDKPTFFDFDKLSGGITGIFGKNYSGKSNIIRAMVWGLYQTVLGGTEAKRLVNIYTENDTGYVKIFLTINDSEFYISRKIKNRVKKNGDIENQYVVEYKYKTLDEKGKVVWVDQYSDKKTADQKEVKDLIIDSIGTFEDFTKVSLQSQGGENDYLSLKQQPKNDLINRYLGLEKFRDRYEFANDTFKSIRKTQKELGDVNFIEDEIKRFESSLEEKQNTLKELEQEKRLIEQKREDIENEINNLISQKEKLDSVETNNLEALENRLKEEKDKQDKIVTEIKRLEKWIFENPKKEIPIDLTEDLESINKKISLEQIKFQKYREEYKSLESWLQQNTFREVKDSQQISLAIEKLLEKNNDLRKIIQSAQGKACPTCGSVTQQPNEELERSSLEQLEKNESNIKRGRLAFKENEENIKHNALIENNKIKIDSLKNNLINLKQIIDNLKEKQESFIKCEDLLKHNQLFESNFNNLKSLEKNLEDNKNLIQRIEENIKRNKSNKIKEQNNFKLDEQINELRETLKGYKHNVYILDKNIAENYGEIKLSENNIQNFQDKLKSLREYEKIYKKYSIYMQAVHRDGIPAQIIKRKLPLINNKINSILKEIVDFQLNLEILTNGDIIEYFFFNLDRSDAMPLTSASGAQKFICNIAIQDALNYISNLTKPSIKIIDEGFGTLDGDLVTNIAGILYYLKNKYKNVIVLTHRSEVKDFVDNVIEVHKTREGIPNTLLEKYPNSGVGLTVINVS